MGKQGTSYYFGPDQPVASNASLSWPARHCGSRFGTVPVFSRVDRLVSLHGCRWVFLQSAWQGLCGFRHCCSAWKLRLTTQRVLRQNSDTSTRPGAGPRAASRPAGIGRERVGPDQEAGNAVGRTARAEGDGAQPGGRPVPEGQADRCRPGRPSTSSPDTALSE